MQTLRKIVTTVIYVSKICLSYAYIKEIHANIKLQSILPTESYKTYFIFSGVETGYCFACCLFCLVLFFDWSLIMQNFNHMGSNLWESISINILKHDLQFVSTFFTAILGRKEASLCARISNHYNISPITSTGIFVKP